jgi:(1->4)-alpha-D-glucan 1-alpha-D-glucosylmutase
VDDILADGRSLFVDDLASQQPYFTWFGLLNSITLTILKLTSPGVPDIYQGNEVTDFSLVDPDNRRPVDYAARRRLLADLTDLSRGTAREIGDRLPALFDTADGRAKLWAVMRLLAFRRRHRALLARGEYQPIAVRGRRERHVVSFVRAHGDEGLLVVAGRLYAGLGSAVGALPVGETVWGDTSLALGPLGDALEFTDVLTGAVLQAGSELRIADAFRAFPGAVLHFTRHRS